MSATRAITLRLDPTDYERLEAEAERLGIAPATLARVYVRAGLNTDGESETDRRRRVGLDALRRLDMFRRELRDAGYPSVDAVKLVREGREELERRSFS